MSWSLSGSDFGNVARTDLWAADPGLPLSFTAVSTLSYDGGAVYDRGHMCPSADRTASLVDNYAVFYMSNILPQATRNNQGLWNDFEIYCRTLARAGHEVLILSGGHAYAGGTVGASSTAVPDQVWKIAVVVPEGPGSALDRIDASTRVIALNTPNSNDVAAAWTDYVTSVSSLEAATGYTFFSALPGGLAATLKAKVDGQVVAGAPTITTQPANCSTMIGGSVTFTVVAVGALPLTYEWFHGADSLGSSTSPQLRLSGVQAADAGDYTVHVTNAQGHALSLTASLHVGALVAPTITGQTSSAGRFVGQSASLAVTARDATGYQWYKGGVEVAGATAATLELAEMMPAVAGLYDCVVIGVGGDTLSAPVVVGIEPAAGQRTAGSVITRDLWQNVQHPNGATYDQFLLSGTAGTFTADPGQIARMSYLDPQGSIVQVEMSGSGAITVVLDPATASGPKAPSLYNQNGIDYMQGKATIILSGADATTHFTIYSVGTATNPGVTKPEANYTGWADVAAAGIVSTDGKLGGIHQGNANYNASVGYAGVYAPGVGTVGSLVVIHDIAASGTAQPVLGFMQGGAVTVKIAGGSLAQSGGDVLTVEGLAKVTMGAGQDSCGRPAPAHAVGTRLVDSAGNDVTAAIVEVGP
ncbi:MAG: DNA/RNA non-specific endonuclease [Opitutaceae bacterium]|nr:DNA/RNA non-specific endonuclease [Opitutaceae bacterium]